MQTPVAGSFKLAGANAQHIYGNSGLYSVQHQPRQALSFERFEREARAIASREQVHAGCTLNELEDKFWNNLGIAQPALYAADLDGSLFSSDVQPWNLNALPDLLRTGPLPVQQPMSGINTPMLYFGSYRSMFPLHTEDMDLVPSHHVFTACSSPVRPRW